jgi:hypothetical protein
MNELVYIPLDRAWLCVGCNAIGESPEQCGACGSRLGLLSLSSVLNRITVSPLRPRDGAGFPSDL